MLEVINSVLTYTNNVIVVNDGSTDETKENLKNAPVKAVVNFEKNQGKGMALRQGFLKALELGFTHVITIDSDGQHKASDLPAFFNAIEEDPTALFIGVRNMNSENVPGSSSFGNNFSSFWFKFETGIDAPDTQSGYRSYPIYSYKNTKFFTSKYEFEIEVIVRSAWKDIPIKFLPIDVYYPPQEERITHFRKVPDFTRISILNTVLVTMALFYYKPRNFIRNLKKKSPKELFKTYIVNSNEPIEKIMLAIFLGSFIGLSPFHGVKTLTIIALSFIFKLNKTVSIGVAYIVGFAPLIPLLIFISHEIGAFILQNNNHLVFTKRNELTIQFVFENIKQQYVGGVVFALAGATIISFIVFLFYKARKNLKK